MKIDFLFFTSLDNIKITSELHKGIHLMPFLFLTNDKKVIENVLPENLFPIIGGIEFDSLKNSDAFIYAKGELPKDILPPKRILIRFLTFVEAFLNSLWFVKDNSVNCELGYLKYGDGIRDLAIDSNFIATRYKLSDRTEKIIEFDSDEIKKAIVKLETIYPHKIDKKIISDDIDFYFTDTTRVKRAILFLHSARNSFSYGQKISSYIAAFEALFSTNPTEITHQISERISFFLSENYDERISIYNDIKKAYSIRSRYVHGDIFSKKQMNLLPDSCSKCDVYLRKTLNKIVEDVKLSEIFKSKNKILETYLVNKIFGNTT